MKGRFSKGNLKLSKDVLIWNLPRLSTCPGAGSCSNWCYEKKIERMYKNTVPFREENLRLSRMDDFVDRVSNYLNSVKEKYVRVHESGDFYDQEYLDKWYKIARKVDKKFFAFTKSFHLDLWKDKPDNFNILQSYGSKWDYKIDTNRPTNRAVDKRYVMMSHQYLCPFNTIRNGGCGSVCTECITNSNVHVVGYIH